MNISLVFLFGKKAARHETDEEDEEEDRLLKNM
jgi:hypothetical protein